MANPSASATAVHAATADRRAHRGAPTTTSVASGALLSPNQVEGVILRMAAVLSADLARAPHARQTHQAYMAGALAIAVAMGVLTDRRALVIREACLHLLDGAPRPSTVSASNCDPALAAMVTAVRRHGGASLNEPLAMAELTPGQAAKMLGELIAAGVVDGGDLTGFHRATKGDC